jgi:LmbE family N-acetylglucosaminyl deacetylase
MSLCYADNRMHALKRGASTALRRKNILVVIAHPDDEVMFFGPTLTGITNSSCENNVRVLCLSNGMCYEMIKLTM